MEQTVRRPVFVDVMSDLGRFICQVRYPLRGKPMLVDGEVKEVYDLDEVKGYVLEQKPSLRNKNIQLAFSNNRV